MSLEPFLNIVATDRAISTVGALKVLRKSGFVPCVLYGINGLNITLTIQDITLERIITDSSCLTRIYHIRVNDTDSYNAIIKDVKFDPISDKIIHVDFMSVSENQAIAINIPIKIVNKEKCPGVKTGGDVYVLSYNVKLLVNTSSIPPFVVVDVEKADIGSKIRLSQIELPNNCKIIKDCVVARVSGKKVITDVVEKTEENKTAEATSAAGGNDSK